MGEAARARLWGRLHAIGASRFVRDVATVASGIAAAQAISLAFMPLLTRLYGPRAFGELAAFTAVVGIVTPLATLGYSNAIVMPRTGEGAAAVARLSLLCTALVTPLACLCVFLFQPHLARWTGLEAAPDLLYLIPVSLVLVALLSVANQSAIREELFRAKTSSYVASKLVDNVGKLLGGLVAPSGFLLIVFFLVSSAVNFAMLLRLVPRQGVFLVRRWFGTAGASQSAREQRAFALYRMPQSILNATAMGLPVLLLTSFFGAPAAGQYSLAVLVLGAPVMLLGQSVGEVFYPRITARIRDGSADAAAHLAKATVILFLVALPPFGLVMLFGPWLFEFAFGAEWTLAGRYAQWIALWSVGMLTSTASIEAFPVLQLQHYLFFQEVLSISLRVAALYAGFAYFGSDLVAIALYSVVGLLLTTALCIAPFIRMRRHARLSYG